MTQASIPKAPAKKKHAQAEEKAWSVASAAYYLAEKRGFAPGRELEDWFEAEKAIEARFPA